MPYYSLQYTGSKIIQWKNFTDTSTPLSAANLQKSHTAINDIDQAVNAGFQAMDNAKLDKNSAGSMISGIDYDPDTGTFVFHHYDQTIADLTINTNLEKIVVNFAYNTSNQKLELTQSDGTVVEVDLSAFIANPDLVDSSEIAWTINAQGQISANIINGSITDQKMQSGYLASVTQQASAASASATSATYQALLAKSYANGTSNLEDRPNESVDNSYYYKEQSKNQKEDAEAWANGTRNGTPVSSDDPAYQNNAKHWAQQSSSGVTDFVGATAQADGSHGLVPAPLIADKGKFLKGDGSWDNPPSASVMTGASASANGTAGLAPQPLIADRGKFLKGDGTWADVPNPQIMTGATSSADGDSGLVPKPFIADRDKFLKGDGTWDEVPDPQTMTGASSSTSGEGGLVPTPEAGDQDKFLAGDGTYKQDARVGALSSLNTTEKNTLVGAINEVDSHADAANTAIGTLTNLNTTEKNSVVGAINEVDSHTDTNTANIGTLANLTTTSKTDLVAAINEVDSHADANATAIAKCECLVLTASAVSALPYTFSNAAIETDMVCIHSVLSNPSAQLADWTVNTDTAGSCVVSGSNAISGSTDITLYLMKSR